MFLLLLFSQPGQQEVGEEMMAAAPQQRMGRRCCLVLALCSLQFLSWSPHLYYSISAHLPFTGGTWLEAATWPVGRWWQRSLFRKHWPCFFNASTHLKLPGKHHQHAGFLHQSHTKTTIRMREVAKMFPSTQQAIRGDKSIDSCFQIVLWGSNLSHHENCQSTSLHKVWEISQHDLMVGSKTEPIQKAIVAPEPLY